MARFEQFTHEGSEYIHIEISPTEFSEMLQNPHAYIASQAPEVLPFVTRGRAINFNIKSFSTSEDSVSATETTSPCVQAMKINGGGLMCICTPITQLQQDNTFTIYASRD